MTQTYTKMVRKIPHLFPNHIAMREMIAVTGITVNHSTCRAVNIVKICEKFSALVNSLTMPAPLDMMSKIIMMLNPIVRF